MFVGVLQVELSIPGSRSLKEERSVLKGLLERTRRRHGVAAAEVAQQDTWDRATVGISFVSSDSRHATSHLQKVLNGLERERDAGVVDAQIEVF